MGFPEIPESKHRPSLKETFIDLLESIALEEIAISHILNAEAEKMQAFVGKCLNFPSKPTNQELIQFNLSVKQLVDTLLMKEWLLLKKLETVFDLKSKIDCRDRKDGDSDETPCHEPGNDNNGKKRHRKPQIPKDLDDYEEEE